MSESDLSVVSLQLLTRFDFQNKSHLLMKIKADSLESFKGFQTFSQILNPFLINLGIPREELKSAVILIVATFDESQS